MKTHKWLKIASKNQKKETKSIHKNQMSYVPCFQIIFEKSMTFNSFFNLQKDCSSKSKV